MTVSHISDSTLEAMGISERKEREKQKRIREIVDAAETVFFSKGYKNATMDEIAEEAELSKGTLYLYFESKETLHLEIVMRGSKMLYDSFQKAVADVEKGLDRVRAIGQAYYKFCFEDSKYFEAMMTYDHRETCFNDLCNEYKGSKDFPDPHIILIESIELGIKDRSIRAGIGPVETSMVLWAFTSGVMHLISTKKGMIETHYNLAVENILKQADDLMYNSLKS